jgi:hypothetical protein
MATSPPNNSQAGLKNGIFSANQAKATTLNASGGQIGSGKGAFKYDVKKHIYPENTSTDAAPDLKHYLAFYINIRGKSKYKNRYKTLEVNRADEQALNTEKLGTVTNAVATGAAAFVGAKVGASATSKLTGLFAKNIPSSVRTIGTIAGGITGAAAGAVAANYFEPDKTFRIDTAIMLAVQERPNVTYGVNYQAQDMGTLAGFLAGGTSAIDSGMLDAGGEAARAFLLNVAQVPAGITNAIGATELDVKAMASLGTGTAMNPFREQIFKSVENRTFDFNYKFLPKSARESENAWRIIQAFKFHMHPELTSGGLFFIYPSQFNIVYYFNDKPNPTLFNISTCVLQNMSVDYGGQQFSTFVPPGEESEVSYPTEINMKLRFVELETLTKERIDEGF